MPIIQSDKLVPKDFDAITIWPFIFVRPHKVDDKGLIEHEKVHLKEQSETLVLPWLLFYWLSKKFRLAAEVRAYQRQIKVGGISEERAAYLLTRYNLDIEYVDALCALRKKV